MRGIAAVRDTHQPLSNESVARHNQHFGPEPEELWEQEGREEPANVLQRWRTTDHEGSAESSSDTSSVG